MRIINTDSTEEWLKVRQSYLTATDIAKIKTGGPAAWNEVKRSKIGEVKNLTGLKTMEFGHDREPEIADFIATFIDDRLAPNNKLCVCDDSRISATPDMLGFVGDSVEVIGEIKTTATGWDEIPKKYWVQVQVQLYVTKAKYCVFAWEIHHDYVPGEIKHELIYPDEDFFKEIEQVGGKFFSEGEALDSWEVLIEEYAQAKRGLGEAKARLDDVSSRMEAFAGDKDVEYKSPLGSVTWKPQASNRFNAKALIEDYPEVAEKYMVFDKARFKREEKELAKVYTLQVQQKTRSLRVTLPKNKE